MKSLLPATKRVGVCIVDLMNEICHIKQQSREKQRCDIYIHCGAKKLHHFIFAITSSKRFAVKQILAHIYPNKFGINDIKIIDLS